MYWRGIDPPKMSSSNTKSLPRGSGSSRILQSPNWPWPPVCFLWRPWASARRRDRLAVRNPRRLQVHLDAEPPLQLRDGDLDVQLALPGEEQLLRLRVARVADRRVLFLEAMHRRADLVLVAAALGLDGIRQHRLRKLNRREAQAALLGDRVVGQRVLQLRDGPEVAGPDLGRGRRGLALHHLQVAEALARVAREIVHGLIGSQRAGHHAKQRNASGEGIRHRLPHERRVGLRGIRRRRLRLIAALGRERTLERARRARHDQVEERLRPDIGQP